MEGKLTVYFDDPFWVGVFERTDEAGYAVARVVFGAEPSPVVLYAWVLQHYAHLPFSQPQAVEKPDERPLSFKRKQRQARQAAEQSGTGTWAQRALQAERERNKQVRQVETRAEREAQEAERFALRQERRKEKHKGH